MEKAQRTLRLGCLLAIILVAATSSARSDSDFFKINSIDYLGKPPRDGKGVWIPGNRKKKEPDVFVPCLELRLTAGKMTRAQGLTIRVHFFDEQDKLARTLVAPSPARADLSTAKLFERPVFFTPDKPEQVYFKVPPDLVGKKWTAIAIFGDKNEITTARYPAGSIFAFDFPEKEFAGKTARNVARTASVDPLIEHVVRTNNPKHPQITLFLRFPNNAKDGSAVDGVVALCVLANSVEDIRRTMQSTNMPEYSETFRFADQHRFAVLCWGSRTVWRPDASYDELERETNIELDRSFDLLAGAWERGILDLHEKYNLPTRNFLMRGTCGSAQWAHRLVLRKPDYFLAAFLHIPSSFDRPTPDAAKVLWLLTAGELDGGYQHGTRWYQDCRAAGYPIIYKPIVGLGHAGSPISDNLGMKFFDYALTLRDQREELDKTWKDLFKKPDRPLPWVEAFRQPEYVGDYLNQEVYPQARASRIPDKLRVPLPTKTLADAWNK